MVVAKNVGCSTGFHARMDEEKKTAAAGIKERVCRKRRCGPATKNPQIYLRFGQRFVFTVRSCSPPPSPLPPEPLAGSSTTRQRPHTFRIVFYGRGCASHFSAPFGVGGLSALIRKRALASRLAGGWLVVCQRAEPDIARIVRDVSRSEVIRN